MSDLPGGTGQQAVPHCYRHPDRETWIRCQRCDRPICPDCMHQASVGFQCPSCVREGRRSTRSGQLAYGGAPSADPRATSIGLIVANALVWVAVMATGGSASTLVDRLALMPLGRCLTPDGDGYYPGLTDATCGAGGTTWIDGVATGSVWELVTSVFTHIEPMHLAFNMLALWFLGPPIETVLGRVRFLAVYVVAALSGSAAVMLFASPGSQTVGASGAIFGLMGALVVIGLKARISMQFVWFWLGINVLYTFAIANVSWQGHFGGLLGGAAAAAVVLYAPRARRVPIQAAGLAVLMILVLAVAAVRAVMLAG